MINAKILSSTSTFNAVKYNDGKTKSRDNKPETGKLLAMRNFAGMEGRKDLTVAEIKSFFKDYGKDNTRIKNQQLHAVLSVKGRGLDEKQLENAAHQYMAKMGYGDVPYIVYFHNDTDNNHVHIVGSRVGQDGKKINSAFEKQRSQVAMQEISKQFGFSIPKDFEVAKNLAFKYKFSSDAQFNLLMERQGFKVLSDTNGYDYVQNGKKAGRVEKAAIGTAMTEPKLKIQEESGRIKQIKALIYKYAPQYSPEIKIVNDKLSGQRDKAGVIQNSKGKFESELSNFLRDKFGIDIVYHGNTDKGKPYGYSLIDNTSQSVFKGSEILPLQKLIEAEKSQPVAAGIEAAFDSAKYDTNTTDTNRGELSIAAEGENYQGTSDNWLQELSALFTELTTFTDSGEENPLPNKKKKRRDMDMDLER